MSAKEGRGRRDRGSERQRDVSEGELREKERGMVRDTAAAFSVRAQLSRNEQLVL